MTDEAKAGESKPKRERRKQEAIVLAPEPEVRLGSWSMSDPAEAPRRGAEIATALADIINQKKLYSVIKNKRGQANKYVKCEGWTTMGAMLGVFPVEDYCRRLADNKGFEAKVNLVRSRDGMVVGSASAECTFTEANWQNRDSFSLRSMALTRATSKAFRLSFSWIIKLAGYEATPAEEMQAEEDATVMEHAVSEEVERQKHGETPQEAPKAQQRPNGAAPTMFISWPKEQDGKSAFVTGLTAVKNFGLKAYIERDAKGIWLTGDQGWMVPAELIPELRRVAEGLQCPIHEQRPK